MSDNPNPKPTEAMDDATTSRAAVILPRSIFVDIGNAATCWGEILDPEAHLATDDSNSEDNGDQALGFANQTEQTKCEYL